MLNLRKICYFMKHDYFKKLSCLVARQPVVIYKKKYKSYRNRNAGNRL